MILPAVGEVRGEAAPYSGGDAFAAQERSRHQGKVAACASGSLSRQARDVQRPRVGFENIGKAIGDRQRRSRIGAKLMAVNVIGAEPIGVDQQAVNNAIESADVGRQLCDAGGVGGWIRHSAVVNPPVDADRPWGFVCVHHRNLIGMIDAVSCIVPTHGRGTPICLRRPFCAVCRAFARNAPCRLRTTPPFRFGPGPFRRSPAALLALKFAHVVPPDATPVLILAGLLLGAAVFAAVPQAELLVLNGVVGLCLVLGAGKHFEETFQLQGASQCSGRWR
jgi:hypothetical protein